MKSEGRESVSEAGKKEKAQGVLYIVATPIGNLDDLSSRAVSVLNRVDVVAAEDTRHSGRLLQHLGLHKRLIALHDHNERDRAGSLLEELEAGRSVALISDAGTPLISDPGYVLVREARSRGLKVSPIPGACALVAALSAAGLPTDRFLFVGFLPAKRSGRRAALEQQVRETATLVFYESPHRILDAVSDIAAVFGEEREVVLGRELTKAFETFYSGSVAEVLATLEADPHGTKGEFVVMIHGAEPVTSDEDAGALDVDHLLRLLLPELPVKKVAKLVAELSGRPKNELYQRALELK
ncbi:16S rRNA (cytidine(1402)-2'-O)-methyltransferase [Marinobacter apostichopi]|uniref:16S rRNA (cytidine(1402)-2'-O)-methyltransferase n=1 Tax=Marinobacter apostichopi TaxID=3035454 RepID=UPI002572FBA6|nr:16S rRNA (cytidine(1402)-2'-O)-methyltransferase [Marinobacter sp. LA51]